MLAFGLAQHLVHIVDQEHNGGVPACQGAQLFWLTSTCLTHLMPGDLAQGSSSALRLQENASKPEGLPPNQGGKYVGFGSGPPPSSKPSRPGAGVGGLDDYQQYLSKGISQLTTVAGQSQCLQGKA